MAGQSYSTQAERIAKFKGEILGHAMPVEVLGICGMQRQVPKNNSKTVVYRRWLPYGATTATALDSNQWDVTPGAHILSEGVTPSADSLVPQDITVQLNQYGCLYSLTDQVEDLYEDDVGSEMKKQTGERMGLVRELVRYGAVKACTNLFYAGGTSTSTVDEKVSITFLRNISRSLQAAHAKRITRILDSSPKFGMAPVEAAYLVFAHTDCEADIRDLPGFKHVSEYGQRKVMHEQEIGSCENFRFVLSPELAGTADSGASVTGTGLNSTTGTSIDIYPMIICGEDAWGQIALRGMNSFDPTYIPTGQKDKNDPLGQRGYIGAKFYHNAVVLNQGWMAVGWVGVSDLTP